MEILTEWDSLQEAMKKIDLSESTMPYVRGKLCESKAYNEMQKILAAPELIKSHNYILNLDPEQLSEDEIDKVQKIYDLGVNRGFIEPLDDEASDEEATLPVNQDDMQQDRSPVQLPLSPFTSSTSHKQNVPCWTVLYSACNADGDVKTGQCYSNSINIRAAKADCYAKLERCGYTNVKILAIEAGDPDSCDCDDEDNICPIDKNVDKLAAKDAVDIDSINVTENDMLKRSPSNGRAQHNGHFAEADHSIDRLDAHVSHMPAKYVYSDVNDSKGVDMMNPDTIEGPTDDEKSVAEFDDLISEFITAADDLMKLESRLDADDPRLTDAYNDAKAAYEDAAAIASKQQLIELADEAQDHGLVVSPDKVTIVDIDESEDVLDETGNPYAAGMKTVDAGGVTPVNVDTKRHAVKKTHVNEDDEDTDDKSNDDSSSDDDDTSSDSEESSSDDDSDEADSDEDTSSDEDADNDSSDDADEDDSDEADSDDDEDDDSDEDDEDASDDDVIPAEDLTAEQKVQLKNDYKKTFKDIMMQCKFEDVCFDDLSIKQKMKFFTKLNKSWHKNEPQDFMSDKEIEQLNKIVIKK